MMSPARRLNDRHPYEIYLLVFTVISTAPGALGIIDVPRSIAGQLTGWQADMWVWGLFIGSLIALAGLAWKRPPYPRITVDGLLLEAVGLVIVGGATIFYAGAVINTGGTNALYAAGVTLAFGAASIAQALKIRRILLDSRPVRNR